VGRVRASKWAEGRALIGRVGCLRGGYVLPTLGRSGKLGWCSDGLTGAEVQVRLAIGVRGNFLRPTRAVSCWTGWSLQCVWTLLGLPGMCTLHANSAREAIIKMCTLPLLAGDNIGSKFVVPTVASSIDIVVHQALERDGARRVREILAVPGRVEGDVVEAADIFVTRGGLLRRADGFPPHIDRFERAGYDVPALLAQET